MDGQRQSPHCRNAHKKDDYYRCIYMANCKKQLVNTQSRPLTADQFYATQLAFLLNPPQSDPYAKAKLAKLFDCNKKLHITKATWKLNNQQLN